MLKPLVAAALSGLSLSATAADWQLVAETKLGQLRLDRASVTREEKFTAAVLVYEFKEAQKLATPPHELFTRRQDGVLVDCAKASLGVAKASFFDGDKVVGAWALKGVDIRFNAAGPGTMAEKVVEAVCAVAVVKP